MPKIFFSFFYQMEPESEDTAEEEILYLKKLIMDHWKETKDHITQLIQKDTISPLFNPPPGTTDDFNSFAQFMLTNGSLTRMPRQKSVKTRKRKRPRDNDNDDAKNVYNTETTDTMKKDALFSIMFAGVVLAEPEESIKTSLLHGDIPG